MKNIIAPSLLSANFANLAGGINVLKDNDAIDWLHLDVMDGHYNKNMTFGFPVIAALRKEFPDMFFDVHLMIEKPEKHIKSFVNAGADMIVFHLEATDEPLKCIDIIKNCRKKAGIAIEPDTPLSELEPYLDDVDMVLCMTVPTGFGGQKLMPIGLEKASRIRALKPHLDIQVDGGVNFETAEQVLKSGANVFVAGALFKLPAHDARCFANLLRGGLNQVIGAPKAPSCPFR